MNLVHSGTFIPVVQCLRCEKRLLTARLLCNQCEAAERQRRTRDAKCA